MLACLFGLSICLLVYLFVCLFGPLHLLLPLIVANTDVTSTDASSVLGATLNMILTRPQAPLTADSATGPAHGSVMDVCMYVFIHVCVYVM